jgi:hypothetical protein
VEVRVLSPAHKTKGPEVKAFGGFCFSVGRGLERRSRIVVWTPDLIRGKTARRVRVVSDIFLRSETTIKIIDS